MVRGLRTLVYGFEDLGDTFQALRAQRLYVSHPAATADERASALPTLARLEREAGELAAAVRTLARLRDVLARPGDSSLAHWRGTNLGSFVVEEHHRLARAAEDVPDLAAGRCEGSEAAVVLLAELSEAARRAVSVPAVSPPR
ncbi:hypothetical protein ACFYZJ_01590 [Streptomyces sp. NPDC001848]|uniref:hypothetical protein n=1 Tax=Streptomyces sp. NPDC001848 TaxID=3364618 RepID=UPI003693AC76